MLLVTLTLLSIITANVQGCGENNFADFCWDDPSIATITYDSTTDMWNCENYDLAQVACTDAVLALLVGTDLTSELCEQLCDVSHADAGVEETLKCEFFRWEKDVLHCTLMNNVQCNGGFNPCNRGKCVSGQTGCSGGDSPLPKDATCAAGVAFVAESVHWICNHPTDQSHINIYGSDEVPAGTSCETAHKCNSFDKTGTGENYLRVLCDAKSSTEKTWIQYPDSPNAVPSPDYMDANSLTLVDPLCDAIFDPLDLNVEKLHETGVSFICENVANLVFTADKVTVSAPNTCALLCNLHHALTLENVLSEAGDGVWMKYDAGFDEGTEVNAENKDVVACWNLMEF